MKKEKELDDLFKNRLEDPVHDTSYLEDDWDSLEQMLGKRDRKPAIIFWLPLLVSAAAVLLLLGWLLFKPQAEQQNQQVAAIHNPKGVDPNKPIAVNKDNSGQSKTTVALSNDHQVNAQKVATGAQPTAPIKEVVVNNSRNNHAANIIPSLNKGGNNKKGQNVNGPVIPPVNNGRVAVTQQNEARPENAALAAVSINSIDRMEGTNQFIALTPVESKDIVGQLHIMKDPVEDGNGLTKLGFVKHPQFTLSVIGASELNGVNSLGDSKSGSNIGLLFSAGVYNKLTITTGASYSAKPYNTNFANYHTAYVFRTDPTQIVADCRVLDIPINLDYQLYNKHRNKFSIGTGLSSYIMLHESYSFSYASTYKGPLSYTVPNEGKYFFGIMNLQATYQRQVNSKFGLSVQPYLKLPLTNIGYSQVRLQTAGVAVGVNWNINSLTKP